MNPLAFVAHGLDSLAAAVSPAWGAKRLAARRAVDRLRSYAAGKHNVGGDTWLPADRNVNDTIASSVRLMRARARQLVRDMPAMGTAVTRLEEFTVGPEILLQARVKDPVTGKLDKTLNQKIEDAWAFWCDQADDARRLHFSEIQQLCCRGEVEAGEYVVIKKYSRSGSRYLPFSLSLYEPDQLVSYGGTPLPGNEIHQGVEYDPRTGRALAYHFEDYDPSSVLGGKVSAASVTRIPAEQCIVGFKSIRPGQLRGVTALAPAILLAYSLREFVENEMNAAAKAARWLAFVSSPDPAATMEAFGAALTPGGGERPEKYTMEFGSAIVDFLKSGEQVTVANSNRPGDAFAPFVRWVVQTFAATVGTTYELLSGDYSDAAYTGARVARNDMLAGIRVRRARLVRQLCEDVRREFLRWGVLTGKLDLPGYFANPAPFLRAVWLGPGMESLDPLREGRADIESVDKLLKSPQEVMLARGRDPEQVLDERKEWDEMLAERGLEPAAPSGGLKTNPATVAKGTGAGDGEDEDEDEEEQDADGRHLRRVK